MIKTELDSMPAEMDELNRKIMQLEMRRQLSRERDRPLKSGQARSTTERRSLQSCVMTSMRKRLSGRTRRALLTRSASFVKRKL